MTTELAADDTAILDLFEHLALDAGRAIMEVQARGVPVETKHDSTPVTEADRAAERVILAGLERALPTIPCVAEEEVAAGNVPDVGCEEFILVDPLDGTREFISGKPDFTVNIALVRNGVPALGVVYAPARGILYSGGGERAFEVDVDGDFRMAERRPVRARPLTTPPVIVASRSHRTPETEEYIARHPGAESVAIGSSLKFCLVAAGRADIYPRFGTTMEWDTAAGDAVLRAAGGTCHTLEGKPLTYCKRGLEGQADFTNPWFVATGGPETT